MSGKDRYVFPAVFDYDEAGITVTFPDLPGCITEGDDEVEALDMARDALALVLTSMEDHGEAIPEPSPVLKVVTGPAQRAVPVDVWMPPHRAAIQERIVRKTLTLPNWLNDLAEHSGVNFSRALQHGLKEILGISETGPAFVRYRRSQVEVSPAGDSGAQWSVHRTQMDAANASRSRKKAAPDKAGKRRVRTE